MKKVDLKLEHPWKSKKSCRHHESWNKSSWIFIKKQQKQNNKLIPDAISNAGVSTLDLAMSSECSFWCVVDLEPMMYLWQSPNVRMQNICKQLRWILVSPPWINYQTQTSFHNNKHLKYCGSSVTRKFVRIK